VILALQTRLTDLATAIATDIKQLRVFLTGSSSGDLTGLTTTAKTDVVAAINEVNAKPTSGDPADASETVKGVVELASLAEVAAGVDTERAVTAAGVRQERTSLKEEILGADVPEALDTLSELADALADDADFAASITYALGKRVRVDFNNQNFTEPEKSNGRINIGAQAAADIGDADADLVAVYTAAKA
jgi:hypothetical protein